MAYFSSRLVGFCHTNAHPSHSALFGLGLSNFIWNIKRLNGKEINEKQWQLTVMLGKWHDLIQPCRFA